MRYEIGNTYGLVLVTSEAAPGCYGDSCANTARNDLLETVAGSHDRSTDLKCFRTDAGYLRHPLSPWREDDFSGDQALPLLASFIANPRVFKGLADEMSERVKWRTGNGKLSAPGLMALARRNYALLALINILSAVIFKLPFRWSDSTHSLERTGDNQNSGDYLNWFAVVCLLHILGHTILARIARTLVSQNEIRSKVHFYFRNEEDGAWVVEKYFKAIDLIYS